MRIGLISDVHGNLPALEAVLADLELQAVDRTICLGDLASGPWPGETVRRLAALEPACVVGNWDAWILDGVVPCDNGETGSKLLALGSFWAEQLDDADRAFMRSAESRLELDTEGGSLLFVHGSPRSYNEPILATTPAEELARMLGDAAPRVLVVGHTHVQMLRRLPETVIVNPGSVGLPFLEWPARDARVG